MEPGSLGVWGEFCLSLFPLSMAEKALLVFILDVSGRPRSDLAIRSVAQEAVFAPLQLMRHFWCHADQEGGRFDPSLRRVASITLTGQVVLRRPVAIAADILRHTLALGVAYVARRALVSPDQGDRVQLWG